MGVVATIKQKPVIKRWLHKLFACPTFWRLKPFFRCPRCNRGMRCYWDGNDITGHGTDYCNACAKILEG